MKTLLLGVKSGQVTFVFQHMWRFPFLPWIDPDISPDLPETLCVCKGLSENLHIRGAAVSGVPPGLVSEVQCLLMNNPSCHSITVNGETLHQVEPSDDQSSDDELLMWVGFGVCTTVSARCIVCGVLLIDVYLCSLQSWTVVYCTVIKFLRIAYIY